MRRTSCVLQIHNARIVAKCHLTPCLPGSSWPNVPSSWLPSSATRVFSPGDLLRPIWYSWCPVDSPGYDSGLSQEFAQRCYVVPCPTHMCGAAVVQADAATVGGADVATERSCCTVLSFALAFLYCVITYRQPRLPTSRSKRQLAWQCLGVQP